MVIGQKLLILAILAERLESCGLIGFSIVQMHQWCQLALFRNTFLLYPPFPIALLAFIIQFMNTLSVFRYPAKPSRPSDSSKHLDWFHCLVDYPRLGQFEWGFIHTKADVVAVLAIGAKGAIGLIEQYRYPYEMDLIENVKGFAEYGETALEAAKRELKEELGKGAHQWHDLGRLPASPGIGKITNHCFCASDLFDVEGQHDEPTGRLRTMWLQPEEFRSRIADGAITDAVTLATVAIASLRGLLLFERNMFRREDHA